MRSVRERTTSSPSAHRPMRRLAQSARRRPFCAPPTTCGSARIRGGSWRLPPSQLPTTLTLQPSLAPPSRRSRVGASHNGSPERDFRVFEVQAWGNAYRNAHMTRSDLAPKIHSAQGHRVASRQRARGRTRQAPTRPRWTLPLLTREAQPAWEAWRNHSFRVAAVPIRTVTKPWSDVQKEQHGPPP